ncbi:MAG: hypothetical protein J7L88_00985, partial [Thermoplasmata archaeon]|nr:hypothetical protein [Thermoplasmata archaeon]
MTEAEEVMFELDEKPETSVVVEKGRIEESGVIVEERKEVPTNKTPQGRETVKKKRPPQKVKEKTTK